ncbi:MAG: AMP-binding protein, partial [Planctomycetes bacterium]|nr:AMP-binding protein [Planctomycetota bacterium]
MNEAIYHVLARFRATLDAGPDRMILRYVDKNMAPHERSWARLLGEAASSAKQLADSGVKRGDILPVMRPMGIELIRDFLGAILLGAVPCVLAPPNRKMSHDVFLRKLLGMIGAKDLRACVIDESLGDFFAEHLARAHPGFRALTPASGSTEDPTSWLARDVEPDDLAFMQHSSGTSGIPKAVEISHLKICAHADAYRDALGVQSDDRIASWLPLYHDMGMVACLWCGLLWDIPASHMSNFDWSLKPGRFLEEITRFKATLTWMPNFAFAYMAKNIPESQLAGIDLSSVRAWVNCSEPVLQSSFDAFINRFSPLGVRKESLSASYAMAENVFAVSQSKRCPLTFNADRTALEQQGVVRPAKPGSSSKTFVSSGRVVKGTEVRIVHRDNGKPLGDNSVGEIALRGSLALSRYHGNEEATAQAIRDGWYHTGDLGFTLDGELFVIGRVKDLIICGGRNVDPTEMEMLANGIEGVIPGRVCCLGVENDEIGTQDIHLVVETHTPREQHQAIVDALKAAVARETDFRI